MMNTSAAERSYDRMLAAGPPEPPLFDLTVEYEIWIADGHLADVTKDLGGQACYASEVDEGFRRVLGSTLIEDVESPEVAEEIVQNLLEEVDGDVIDMDGPVITAETIESDEPDWDAIAKDERMERDLDL